MLKKALKSQYEIHVSHEVRPADLIKLRKLIKFRHLSSCEYRFLKIYGSITLFGRLIV